MIRSPRPTSIIDAASRVSGCHMACSAARLDHRWLTFSQLLIHIYMEKGISAECRREEAAIAGDMRHFVEGKPPPRGIMGLWEASMRRDLPAGGSLAGFGRSRPVFAPSLSGTQLAVFQAIHCAIAAGIFRLGLGP